MADLSGQQLKDSYQNLLTIDATIESNPLSGQLENGLGNAITALGIGTDSPSTTLHLDVTSGDNIISAVADAGNSAIFLSSAGSGKDNRFAIGNGKDLMFETTATSTPSATGTERMRISGGGDISFRDTSANQAFYWDASTARLGLGTDSPANTLTIKGGAHQLDIETDSSGVSLESIDRTALSDPSDISYYARNGSHKFFNGSYTEAMRIDSSGNVGMNATPENSAGTWRNYQLGSLSMAGRANDSNPDAMFGTNFKFTTANAEQRISAHATSRIFFNDDVITFQNAGSGTAGSAISWSPRMTIDSSGNVGIGADLPTSYTNGTTLEIKGKTSTGAGLLKVTNANGTTSGAFYAGSSSLVLSAQTTHNLSLGTDNQTRMTIDTSGHVTVQDGGFLIIDTGAVGANPRLYFRQDDINATNFIEVDRGTNAMEFWNNGSERMRILSGGGITFNGDTASANALDDYEEGTWTPVLRGSATAGTYETTTASGFYTKVGRMVTITARVILASSITGGGTGYAQVTGVPFAKGDDMAPSGSVLLRGVDIDNAGLYANVEFTTASAGSVLYFPVIKDNAFTADTQISGFSASDSFNFSITYFT
jgi:hypothetical protein